MVLGLVAVIALGIAWWWSRPGGEWACQRGSNVDCAAVLDVDVDGFDGEEWQVAFRGFDASPERRRFAVAIRPRDVGIGTDARARLLLFDLTASVNPIVVDRSPGGEPLADVDSLDWSVDGSVLAAHVGDSGRRYLVLIDPAAGDYTTTHERPIGSRCPTFGLSPDRTVIQCGINLVAVETGDVVGYATEVAEGAEPVLPAHAFYRGFSHAESATGVVARNVEDGIDLEPGGLVAVAPSATWLGFDDRSGRLVVLHEPDNGNWWNGPRRRRPGGRVTWVDVASGTIVGSVETARPPRHAAIGLDDGWTAIVDDGGRVFLLRPTD